MFMTVWTRFCIDVDAMQCDTMYGHQFNIHMNTSRDSEEYAIDRPMAMTNDKPTINV